MNELNSNQIAIYETDDGQVKISVLFDEDNFWLTQKLMAELFECSVDNISLHLRNIFKDRELDKNSVVEEYSTTASGDLRDVLNLSTYFFHTAKV